jgi:hypothetical protein
MMVCVGAHVDILGTAFPGPDGDILTPMDNHIEVSPLPSEEGTT